MNQTNISTGGCPYCNLNFTFWNDNKWRRRKKWDKYAPFFHKHRNYCHRLRCCQLLWKMALPFQTKRCLKHYVEWAYNCFLIFGGEHIIILKFSHSLDLNIFLSWYSFFVRALSQPFVADKSVDCKRKKRVLIKFLIRFRSKLAERRKKAKQTNKQ